MATSAKAVQQIKKKKWVQIIAPKVFNQEPIGETFISEFQEAVGKEVSVSLMALTGDPQKQNVILSFKMIGSNNNVITTQALGFRLTPAAIRKTMRKGKEKIEDSFNGTTQDNVKVLIKPLLVTKGHATGSVTTNLRKTMKVNVIKMLSSTTFETILLDLMTQKFQRALSDMLRKIYPLSVCEIKFFSIVKDTKENKNNTETAPIKTEAKQEPVQVKSEEKSPVATA